MVKQGPKKYKCRRTKAPLKYDCSVRVGVKVKVFKKRSVEIRSFPKGKPANGSGRAVRTLNQGDEVTITHFNIFDKPGYRIHEKFSREVHFVGRYAVCPIDEYDKLVALELKAEAEALRKAQLEKWKREQAEAERKRKAQEEAERKKREEAERRAAEMRRMKAEAERKRAEAERRRKMEAHKEEFWYVVFVSLCLCVFVSVYGVA